MDPVYDADRFVPAGYDLMFTLVLILVIGTVIVVIALAVRRFRKLRNAGIDPLDPAAHLMIRAAESRLMAPLPTEALPTQPAPRQSLTERLAELDALHRAGTITTAERDAARAKLLGTL
ncbi:hypothetical protein Xcel_3292 [Xylanimonas cellulosilytica DSM 15894]|uniref:SHOCT domain-containing protein n=1 Tax=Xylanimonas cellulosilytica (strain DSM 15894 / JCM 12276 / CECT 5975 / KCTC 9989 / LMG 20990 / NBRC 107835 / XIL07) TaxID=446471 RepID=D1BRM6_XYLCX|nr:hypothetical protein [Xylanimonas cellulosilytica]ACZ32292.1 hypothetical protein Xcel_3292 [Xylanimonas cellulosilytica DSM 15894]